MKTRFLVALYHQFFKHKCPSRAAALAYTTLLSIVPFALFSLYIFSFVPSLQHATAQVEQFIIDNFVASSATLIQTQFHFFIEHVAALSWTNIISLGVTSVLLIYNMVHTINHVWEVELHMSVAISFGMYLLFVIIAPLLFGILLMVTSYVTTLPFLTDIHQVKFFRHLLVQFSPFIMEWFIFTLFNWILPSTVVRFKYACIAGLITMLLFEGAKFMFVVYLHFFPTYQLIYGAVASIPIFLIWIYVSWLILLLGVAICFLLQHKPYLKKP